MSTLTLAMALAKLVSAGISLTNAVRRDGFDEAELTAIKKVIDAGAGLASLFKAAGDTRPAAQYLALTTQCFGSALARYWAGSTIMVPAATSLPEMVEELLAPKRNARRREIDTRTKYAASRIAERMSDAQGVARLQQLADLVGDPLGSLSYRALWDAFTNPNLCQDELEQLTILDPASARDFEEGFRLAWVEALATPVGQQLHAWRLGLVKERSPVLLRVLAEDLAAWGRRHVFGNARDQPPGDPVPFMALDEVYVEPLACVSHADRPAEAAVPIQQLLASLLDRHRIVVVRADFGHGKSLSARWLARNLARAWLQSPNVSMTQPYPVFVKCVRDILAEYNHDTVVRRALRATAQEAIGQVEAIDSEMYRYPSKNKTWLILDGLDEIAFHPNQLREMFSTLDAHTSDNCHAVIFTRPGALPDKCLPKEAPVVDLMPFDEERVCRWLVAWSRLPGQVSLGLDELRKADVDELASVPIFLLMVAMTWNEHLGHEGKLDQVRLYEYFFQRIARGKHDGDSDQHLHIQEASRRLLFRLQHSAMRVLDEQGEEVDAMLWMMSRAAWEAHALMYGRASKSLQQRHVEAILADELGLPSADVVLVKIGLLLALQADPSGDGATLLFGHQSFREYLVARYWRTQLIALVTHRERRQTVERDLMRARLLQPNDKAFVFLSEMLSTLDPSTLARIAEWAEGVFNDEHLVTSGGNRLRDDLRSVLRESALAIGCEAGQVLQSGARLSEPDALLSLWLWFEVCGLRVNVWAPGLRCAKLDLSGARLDGANLKGADMGEVILSGARAVEAIFDYASMQGARCESIDGFGAQFVGADLTGADLQLSSLSHATFVGARLVRADLRQCDLMHAAFRGADLQECDFQNALLFGADFRGALVKRTVFRNIQCSPYSGAMSGQVRTMFDGLSLCGVDLSGAQLRGVSFVDADLRGANFAGAELKDCIMKGAVFDRATRWPQAFSESRALRLGARIVG